MNKLTFKLLTLLAFIMSLTTSAYSHDILTLTNQMKFEGDVLKIKNCLVKFKTADKKVYNIPAQDILRLEFEDPNDKVYTSFIELQNDGENCLKGQQDAHLYHGKAGGHIALGILTGVFGVIGAAVANPTPEKGKNTYIMSKNRELFQDPEYLTCYKKKAKGQNVGNTAIGMGIWILLIIII